MMELAFLEGDCQNFIFLPKNIVFVYTFIFGLYLCFRLMLDISTSDTSLPPGSKLQITLERAEDSFILMCPDTDLERYKLVLMDCNLYVPIGQLSQTVFNELNTLFATRNVCLNYRKTEVRAISLSRNKAEYFSDNLFAEDYPIRVIGV